MHIMEGFLPLYWALFWWIVALPCLVFGVYKLRKVLEADREALPLLGVTGGFIFILSSLKLPSVTGSCSHPTGTGLSAVCFGPWITSVICAIVLLFQSLFLAHGGLSVLGANIVSMGIVGPLVGWGVYRLLRDTGVNMYITVFLAVALAEPDQVAESHQPEHELAPRLKRRVLDHRMAPRFAGVVLHLSLWQLNGEPVGRGRGLRLD